MNLTVVDAHVHCHPCFEAEALLDAAARNLRAAGESVSPDGTVRGVICLTEMGAADWFSGLRAQLESGTAPAGWTLHPTGEERSVRATSPRHPIELVIIAGRQISTLERLEVLHLATTRRISDGASLDETLSQCLELEGLVVLPWAVGKWTGSRGRRVTEALRRHRGKAPRLFAGDNGGRPWFWPSVDQFKEAPRSLVSGSDPLPLRGQEARVGSFGFRLKETLPSEAPATWLCDRLAAGAAVESFGPRESTLGFIRNQIGLRLRRHG